jgi:hypothetical protein
MWMDIIVLNEKTLRVKGKTSSMVIDPTSSIPKTEADALVYLENNPELSDSRVQLARIKIKGPGEYEVGGIKYSVIRVDDRLVAQADIDSVRILVGDGNSIEKILDKVENTDLVIINADKEFNFSILTSIEPKVLLVYGSKKNEVSKSLGKTDVMNTNKFSITVDKLPTEMQYVILG